VQAVFLVMACADVLAEAAVWHAPGPIIEVMGGIRYSESARVLRGGRGYVMFFGGLSLPGWLGGAVVCVARIRSAWQGANDQAAGRRRQPWGLAVAILSLLVWIPLLSIAQPEQQNRRRVEGLLKQGQVAEALEEMSRFSPEDFPPHWAPPSREE